MAVAAMVCGGMYGRKRGIMRWRSRPAAAGFARFPCCLLSVPARPFYAGVAGAFYLHFNLGRGFSVVSDMAAEALGLNTSIVTKIYEYKDTSATPVADGKPICGSVGFMGRTSTVSATTPSVPFSANTGAKKMFVSTGYDAKQIQMIANAMAYNTAVGAYNVLDEKMTVLAADIVSEKPDIDAGRFQEGINAYVRTFRKGYNADINQMDSTHGQEIGRAHV